jgi:hypothetical protein
VQQKLCARVCSVRAWGKTIIWNQTRPASSTITLLGKRKGETEISTSDEQRHLKIRKWEDYLEEEVESENEPYQLELLWVWGPPDSLRPLPNGK